MNTQHMSQHKLLSVSVTMVCALFISGLYPRSAVAAPIKVMLEGSQEVPAVKSVGAGGGDIVVNADKSVSGSITTSAIIGTMAHIHVGAKGISGPVAITFNKQGDTYTVPVDARLTDAQYESFKKGELYVNVHTAANPNGEIRGQLKP